MLYCLIRAAAYGTLNRFSQYRSRESRSLSAYYGAQRKTFARESVLSVLPYTRV